MKKRFIFATLVCIVAAFPSITTTAQEPATTFPVIVVFRDDAPFRNFRGNYHADARASANAAAWQYLDRDVVGTVQALEEQEGFRAQHVYSAAIRGFAGRLTERQINALARNPWVASIEADGVMTVNQRVKPPSGGGGQIIPWGIDRVGATISSTQAGNGSGAVTNVHVYVIDTGIDVSNTDLNVVEHVNFVGDGINTDCRGHGTHVAGTIAASDGTGGVVGVAPGAALTGVKVLNCLGSGSASDVIKGVDWVTQNAARPAIANMSLGGGRNNPLDRAVKRSVQSGIFYAIAAGNSGSDACNISPARTGSEEGVMTVAATDNSDQEASWSNYGACVDIWAPGMSILSSQLGGGTTTKSGTSMAAPHAGGTAALFLSSYPTASPADVEAALKIDAETNGTFSKDGRRIARDYAGRY